MPLEHVISRALASGRRVSVTRGTPAAHSHWVGKIVAHSTSPAILIEQDDGSRVLVSTNEMNVEIIDGVPLPTDAQVESANGQFGYLRRIGDHHRLFTFDLDTGEFSSPRGGATGEEYAQIAASVLPGLTAEQVSAFYSAWLEGDEIDERTEKAGDDEHDDAMVAALSLSSFKDEKVTFQPTSAPDPSVTMSLAQWCSLGRPVDIRVTIDPVRA